MRKMLLSLFASLLVAIVHAAPTVITEQPEGESKTYSRSGAAYRDWMGYWKDTQDGTKTELVFSSDGKTVYWKNPVTKYTQDSWIQGELNEDGTKIVFPAGQYLYYNTKQQYGYQLYHIYNIVLDSYGYDYESFSIDYSTPITLSVDGTTLKLEGTSDTNIIASVSDDDDPAWNYYGDAETVLTLFTDIPIAAPDDMQTSTYILRYGSEGNTKRNVNVGFSGNEMYIQGIYSYLPDAWLKGTVDGNTVTFTSGQYIGDDEGTMVYWVAATAAEEWDDYWGEMTTVYKYADKITFQYDPETGTYTGDKTLIVSSVKDGINRWGTYVNPVLTPYEDTAATPADPVIDEFANPGYDEDEGEDVEGYFDFYIYTQDVNGKDLNADNIYYRLYVNNDQLLTLTKQKYEELDEDMSEFRYDFTDYYDFYIKTTTGYHSIYLYDTYERIGVQVIYRGGGEEHASNIVYSDGSVTPTSVGSIQAVPGTVRTEYFDLSGRRISKNAPGQVVIKRTIDADGRVSTSKVVTR